MLLKKIIAILFLLSLTACQSDKAVIDNNEIIKTNEPIQDIILGGGGDIIHVGNEAIDRATGGSGATTWVDKTAPSDGTGHITQIELWVFSSTGATVQVAIFSASGNDLTTRSVVTLTGSLATGYHSFTTDIDGNPIYMEIETGDYIGYYNNSGGLDVTTTSGGARWYKSGDNIPCSATTFTAETNRIMSLYGTGVTPSTDTCTYSGTGNWVVQESDNCYISSDVYVNGSLDIIGSSTGAFNCNASISYNNRNMGGNVTINKGASCRMSNRN